jgi:hypothetical protein
MKAQPRFMYAADSRTIAAVFRLKVSVDFFVPS